MNFGFKENNVVRSKKTLANNGRRVLGEVSHGNNVCKSEYQYSYSPQKKDVRTKGISASRFYQPERNDSQGPASSNKRGNVDQSFGNGIGYDGARNFADKVNGEKKSRGNVHEEIQSLRIMQKRLFQLLEDMFTKQLEDAKRIGALEKGVQLINKRMNDGDRVVYDMDRRHTSDILKINEQVSQYLRKGLHEMRKENDAEKEIIHKHKRAADILIGVAQASNYPPSYLYSGLQASQLCEQRDNDKSSLNNKKRGGLRENERQTGKWNGGREGSRR